MSKGLGKLQRDILNTLEEAKQAAFRYCGTARQPGPPESSTWRYDRPGWVIVGGGRRNCVQIAERVYDLRASRS